MESTKRTGILPALIRINYLDVDPLMQIYRISYVIQKCGSYIWKSFQKVMGLFVERLAWSLGTDIKLLWAVTKFRAADG